MKKEGEISIAKQCQLLGVPRSSYSHKSGVNPRHGDELLMWAMDSIYMEDPTYGSRRICDELELLGYSPSRDRVWRLMRLMGIGPIYPKPRLSTLGKETQDLPLPTSLCEFSNQGLAFSGGAGR